MEEVVKEAPVTEEQEVVKEVTETKPQPGEKTDPALLLKSLHDEREKRRLVEEELAQLKTPPIEAGDIVSDEGKILKSQIDALQEKLSSKEKAEMLSALQSKFPALQDKKSEFDEFLAENAGMKLETAAKAFLVERDLLQTPPPRKGLEKPSGGGRAPVKEGYTAEEADNLRVNNYNEYARLVRSGKLTIN